MQLVVNNVFIFFLLTQVKQNKDYNCYTKWSGIARFMNGHNTAFFSSFGTMPELIDKLKNEIIVFT